MLGLALAFSGISFGQKDESAAIASITEAELRDHIYFLASDFMRGRVGPSEEYEIAAQYVATQFAEAGLEPLVSEQGNMEGYFQEVPYEKLVFDTTATWMLHSKKGDTEFNHKVDYKILEGRFIPESPLEVVFAGYGIHEPDFGWDDFKDIDVAGKMVVLMIGAPVIDGEPVLPDSIHQQYISMMGLNKKAIPLIQQGPAAVILLLDKLSSAMIPFDHIPSTLPPELYQYKGPSKEKGDFRIPMIYLVKQEVVSSIFEGQKFDPASIEEEGMKKYKPYQLKGVTIDTRFPVLERTEVYLKNVVGMVPGTDPELSQQYITVGAHLDHVKHPSGEVANGADDDASGCAGVMEIAEAVAMDPPRRPVVFITYTAEEMGLQGSHYFVNAGPLEIGEIKFNVNLDMIGRTTEENKETGSHYVLADSKYEKEMIPFLSEINDATIQLPLIYDFHHQYNGSSDHASYSNVGIPSFFFFSGDHQDLHSPGDDPGKIEYDKAAKISRLAYLITMKLANMDEVPDFEE